MSIIQNASFVGGTSASQAEEEVPDHVMHSLALSIGTKTIVHPPPPPPPTHTYMYMQPVCMPSY